MSLDNSFVIPFSYTGLNEWLLWSSYIWVLLIQTFWHCFSTNILSNRLGFKNIWDTKLQGSFISKAKASPLRDPQVRVVLTYKGILFLKKKWFAEQSSFLLPLIRLPTVQENEYIWFAKRAKDEKDDFLIFCCLLAHIFMSEMLTSFSSFLSLLDQAPFLSF